jgi:hypothetical protein
MQALKCSPHLTPSQPLAHLLSSDNLSAHTPCTCQAPKPCKRRNGALSTNQTEPSCLSVASWLPLMRVPASHCLSLALGYAAPDYSPCLNSPVTGTNQAPRNHGLTSNSPTHQLPYQIPAYISLCLIACIHYVSHCINACINVYQYVCIMHMHGCVSMHCITVTAHNKAHIEHAINQRRTVQSINWCVQCVLCIVLYITCYVLDTRCAIGTTWHTCTAHAVALPDVPIPSLSLPPQLSVIASGEGHRLT